MKIFQIYHFCPLGYHLECRCQWQESHGKRQWEECWRAGEEELTPVSWCHNLTMRKTAQRRACSPLLRPRPHVLVKIPISFSSVRKISPTWNHIKKCVCAIDNMKRLMAIPLSNRRLAWKYQKPAFYSLATRSVGRKKTTNGWLSIRKRILNSYLNWTMIKLYLLVYLTLFFFFFFLVNRIWGAYPFD